MRSEDWAPLRAEAFQHAMNAKKLSGAAEQQSYQLAALTADEALLKIPDTNPKIRAGLAAHAIAWWNHAGLGERADHLVGLDPRMGRRIAAELW